MHFTVTWAHLEYKFDPLAFNVWEQVVSLRVTDRTFQVTCCGSDKLLFHLHLSHMRTKQHGIYYHAFYSMISTYNINYILFAFKILE